MVSLHKMIGAGKELQIISFCCGIGSSFMVEFVR